MATDILPQAFVPHTAAEIAPAAQPSPLRRFYRAVIASRQRQAERVVARYLQVRETAPRRPLARPPR